MGVTITKADGRVLSTEHDAVSEQRGKFISNRRLWTDAKRTRVLEDGHQDARFLLCGEGSPLSIEDGLRYGILTESVRGPEPKPPAAPPAVKDRQPSETKDRQPAEKKEGEGEGDAVTGADGKCGRPKSNGDPCSRNAGYGTDHKGTGACKAHGG